MGKFQALFLNSLNGPLAERLDLKSEALISFYMESSSIEDPFRYRAKRLGLRIAHILIDEKGDLNRGKLSELRGLFDKGYFPLGPGREADPLIYRHIDRSLQALDQNKEIWTAIQKCAPPLCHKQADEVIRETLWPEQIRVVQPVHVRKAVIAAWLTLLRQTTGSCFATAPAILIQQTDPLRFLKDLYDLLTLGQLKRTVAGKECSVPLSLNSGQGGLQKLAAGSEFSPGVSAAFDAVGIQMGRDIQDKIRAFSSLTVEKMFRAVLLEVSSLTEEDVENEEYLSRIQMTPLLAKHSAVYYQRPSERAQKVAGWKKKWAKACTAFRTFTDCALLHSWEYSIASFSDIKTEFARWNLYIGLGLHPDQKGGIGAFLFSQVNGSLQKCQREIDLLSREYEQAASAISALETMIRGAGSEARLNQLKAEMGSHSLSIQTIIEARNQQIAKANSLVGFFSSLMEQYDQRLQEAFQELFDPALFGEEAHLYDDSSAGFRLVYKHGRRDASQWTAIYDGVQYIDALRDFFSHVENDLTAPAEIGKGFIEEITTALIQFIQEPLFLQGALARAKEKGRRSPWDYISGGTLQTLLGAYCGRERPFTERSIIPHSAEDLLRFLSSAKKENFFLMHSPTHAFIFYPNLLENLAQPRKKRPWTEEMQEHLVHRISERLPEEERGLFIHLYRQKIGAETDVQFRSHLIDAMGPRIKQKEGIIDAVLYEHSPLFTEREAKEAAHQVLQALGRRETVQKWEGSFFGSYEVCQMIQMTLLAALRNSLSEEDWPLRIAEAMRKFGFAPQAALFADTNWSGWFFGWTPNPATGQMELWRLNRTATQGFPMTDWKQWLTPGNSAQWTLLAEPKEYAFSYIMR
ncbi:MAG: hypothetical protein WCF19_03125 [Chlamydiales bacterium]